MPSARAQLFLGYIAGNLRRIRLNRGLTQERLAEAADLDLRYLQRVERGMTNLSVAVVIALADALDVPPGALFKKSRLPVARRGRPSKRRSGNT